METWLGGSGAQGPNLPSGAAMLTPAGQGSKLQPPSPCDFLGCPPGGGQEENRGPSLEVYTPLSSPHDSEETGSGDGRNQFHQE